MVFTYNNIILVYTINSNNLPKCYIIEMGLKFWTSGGSPDFNIVIIEDIFQTLGKIARSKERLNSK